MARIGSYPIDAVIQDKDAWIGTENTNRVTRQFTALGVAQYIDTKNVGLVFVGATANDDGAKGLVPAPVAGQEGMYLKGNLGGGWTTIPVYTLDVPAGTTNVNLINTDGAGAIINSFITLTGGTYLTSVHTSGSQITFNHDNTTRSDTTSTSSPAAGASVPLVASVTSNATGHITAIDVKTVTWPADSDTTYTIDVPNATTSINLAGSDGTNDPIAFTTVAGNNGMTISRTDANTLNFNSKWQINNVNQDGYVPKGTANANKFWATDANGNPGWTFQPSQDQTLTSTGTTNASTGIVLSQNGGTVIVKGDGSTISASSNNTTNVITLAAINRVNTTYTLPVAAGAANTAVINLTDNSAIVSSVTFNGTANKIAISETVGNNGDITIGMPDDVTVTGELTVSGTGQSSFGGQITIPQTPSADTDAASKKYVDDLVSGGLTFRGTFNAATGEILSGVSSGSQLYNCPGGAGTRIAVAVGDYYIVATAGGSFYCSGATLDIGDSIIATAAANADASVVTGWSVVQSDEGVASFTNANGTFVSAGTVNSNATGAVTMGTIDLSATGTKDGTTFLRGDNTWAVPAYVSYSAMTTSTLGLGKIKYDFGSTPAAESQSTTTARTYGVTKNASDQLVVNVPWLNSSDVNSVTASGATTALSGLTSTPNTGSVVIGLDINGRASLGSPAGDDELMIYDTSTAKNVKVLVSDLASYAGSAATNQVTYWTSANEIGGATGFTFAGGATGAITMGGALTTGGAVRINGTTTTGLVIASSSGSSNGLKLYNNSTTDNAYIYNHFDGNLEIGTNNATVLTMNGTSSTFAGTVETTTLRTDVINNKANSANIIYRSGTDTIIGGGSASQKLTIADAGWATFSNNVFIAGGDTNTGYDRYLKLYGNSDPTTNVNRWAGLAVYNNGGNNVNELAFFTGSGDSARTEKLRISSTGNATFAGNVGVAGKTPAYGLNLAQGTGANNKIAWTDGTPDFAASIYASSSTDKLTFATKNASNVETTALEIDTSQNATFAGEITTGGKVQVNEMLTISYSDISSGENRGLKILNTNSSGQQWNITAGRAGQENTSFVVRDSSNNVDAIVINEQTAGTTPLITVANGGNTTFAGDVILGTGDSLYAGSLRLVHDGSNALFINQTTGDIKIQNSASDKDIIFKGLDGASSIDALTLDMSNGGSATFRDDIDMGGSLNMTGSSKVIRLNSGGYIDFDSTNLQFNTQRNPNTGAFNDANKSHAHIGLQGPDGGSKILFGTATANNTVATTRVTINSSGSVSFTESVYLPDAKKVVLGSGSDFQLYHDGSNSYIQNLTGWLNVPLSQNGISIANADFSESVARFLLNGAVELYYDGAKKFETVSTGVDVFGTSGNTNVRVYDSSGNSEVGLKLQGDAATWTLQNWGSGGDKLRVLNNAGTSIQVWEDDGNVIFGATDINGSFGASNTVVAIKGSSSGGEGILQITGLGNNATDNVGKIDFHSYAEADAMCSIRSVRGSADDQGELQIWTNNGGAPTEKFTVSKEGLVYVNKEGYIDGGFINGFRTAIQVGQSAVAIGKVATYGGLAMVWMNYAGNIGYDLVSYSLSQVTVLSSQAISGGTSSRTYTAVSGVLKLTMGGSDTYSVYATEIRTANT